MKKRVRFGIKVPIFVNAATFVFYLDEPQAEKFQSHVEQIVMILRLAGQDRLAERIVFDMR